MTIRTNLWCFLVDIVKILHRHLFVFKYTDLKISKWYFTMDQERKISIKTNKTILLSLLLWYVNFVESPTMFLNLIHDNSIASLYSTLSVKVWLKENIYFCIPGIINLANACFCRNTYHPHTNTYSVSVGTALQIIKNLLLKTALKIYSPSHLETW